MGANSDEIVVDGQYGLRERIQGHEGMDVYRAESGGMSVLIHFFRGYVQEEDPAFATFEERARLLCRLSHPRMVDVLDFGSFRGRPYLVTEYLSAATLDESVGRGQALNPIEISLAVTEALRYAHREGFMHGAMSGSQVLVREDGSVKLAGVGVAALVAAFAGTTAAADPKKDFADLDRVATKIFAAARKSPKATASAPAAPAALAAAARSATPPPRAPQRIVAPRPISAPQRAPTPAPRNGTPTGDHVAWAPVASWQIVDVAQVHRPITSDLVAPQPAQSLPDWALPNLEALHALADTEVDPNEIAPAPVGHTPPPTWLGVARPMPANGSAPEAPARIPTPRPVAQSGRAQPASVQNAPVQIAHPPAAPLNGHARPTPVPVVQAALQSGPVPVKKPHATHPPYASPPQKAKPPYATPPAPTRRPPSPRVESEARIDMSDDDVGFASPIVPGYVTWWKSLFNRANAVSMVRAQPPRSVSMFGQAALEPSYMSFLRRYFPAAPARGEVSQAEHRARTMNLALTCVFSILALAFILHVL
jgi:serine/threonine-protein kinase